MLIPDPKPMPLTDRARVLRELATLQRMTRHVRSKAPWRQASDPRNPSREMKGDLGLCEAIESAIQLGRKIAAQLIRPRADIFRPSKEVLTFMDLAYAVKADFFCEMRHADEWFGA